MTTIITMTAILTIITTIIQIITTTSIITTLAMTMKTTFDDNPDYGHEKEDNDNHMHVIDNDHRGQDVTMESNRKQQQQPTIGTTTKQQQPPLFNPLGLML